MGGDRAPGPEVEAAARAADEGLRVALVGDTAQLRAELQAAGRTAPASGDGAGPLSLVHASGRVSMTEDAALALRRQPDASIRVAARLLAETGAAALVSAGPTGATVGAALLEVGRVEGVRRPAVAAVLPVPDTHGVVLVDAGGSPDAPVEAMVGYARMGTALAGVRGVAAPRVGLLNVGHEPGKGNALAREAYHALSPIPGFVGNVEPSAVLQGAVDVLVADAFAGNVFLKTLEATAVMGGGRSGDGASAVVLGVRAPVLVTHGAADGDDLLAALHAAREAADAGLASEVASALAPSSSVGNQP